MGSFIKCAFGTVTLAISTLASSETPLVPAGWSDFTLDIRSERTCKEFVEYIKERGVQFYDLQGNPQRIQNTWAMTVTNVLINGVPSIDFSPSNIGNFDAQIDPVSGLSDEDITLEGVQGEDLRTRGTCYALTKHNLTFSPKIKTYAVNWKHEWSPSSSCALQWFKLKHKIETHELKHVRDSVRQLEVLQSNVASREKEFRIGCGKDREEAIGRIGAKLLKVIGEETKKYLLKRDADARIVDFESAEFDCAKCIRHTFKASIDFQISGPRISPIRVVRATSGSICGDPDETHSAARLTETFMNGELNGINTQSPSVWWTPDSWRLPVETLEVIKNADSSFSAEFTWNQSVIPSLTYTPNPPYKLRVPLIPTEEVGDCRVETPADVDAMEGPPGSEPIDVEPAPPLPSS